MCSWQILLQPGSFSLLMNRFYFKVCRCPKYLIYLDLSFNNTQDAQKSKESRMYADTNEGARGAREQCSRACYNGMHLRVGVSALW